MIHYTIIITRSNFSRYYIGHCVITVTESESDIRITTDTPNLALTVDLCGVYFENFGENWPRYNGTTLHFYNRDSSGRVNSCITSDELCTRHALCCVCVCVCVLCCVVFFISIDFTLASLAHLAGIRKYDIVEPTMQPCQNMGKWIIWIHYQNDRVKTLQSTTKPYRIANIIGGAGFDIDMIPSYWSLPFETPFAINFGHG